MRRSGNASSFYEAADIEGMLRAINLRRIKYIAAAFLLFQILTLISTSLAEELLPSFIVAAVICLEALIITIFYSDKLFERPGNYRVFYLSFWLLLFWCLIPNFISEMRIMVVRGDMLPLTMTLFCVLLAVVPIFKKLEIFIIFPVFFIGNTIAAYIAGASLMQHVYIFVISMTGMLFSYLIQYHDSMSIWQMSFESQTDSLTGLLSRKAGLDKMRTTMELCRRHKKKMAVYMVDIDYFKSYNDCYGHIQGDVALRLVSDTLRDVFARASDIVFRFGGEEFVICANFENDEEPELMKDRLHHAVALMDIKVPENPIASHLTVSIGYAVYCQDNAGDDELLIIDRADAAMYHEKRVAKGEVSL